MNLDNKNIKYSYDNMRSDRTISEIENLIKTDVDKLTDLDILAYSRWMGEQAILSYKWKDKMFSVFFYTSLIAAIFSIVLLIGRLDKESPSHLNPSHPTYPPTVLELPKTELELPKTELTRDQSNAVMDIQYQTYYTETLKQFNKGLEELTGETYADE